MFQNIFVVVAPLSTATMTAVQSSTFRGSFLADVAIDRNRDTDVKGMSIVRLQNGSPIRGGKFCSTLLLWSDVFRS